VIADEFVVFRDVVFRHAGGRGPDPAVLEEVSFSIRRGEFFCLLGPSGCGKTSVLNLLAGFEAPTAGEIRVGGRLLHGPSVERSVVFQGDESLYHWLTALENVEFGLRVAGKPKEDRRVLASQCLALVGLKGQEHKYPAQLSGGMKQRVKIARALVGESDVLLMDEPFAALDAQTRTMLQDELVDIWSRTGRTILFVTHDIHEAITLGDRIGVMHRGPRSRIREIIACDLPRPRDRSDPRFGQLYARINRIVADEVLSRQ
jgi:NitT/TauT family transport system ATP-binding protein